MRGCRPSRSARPKQRGHQGWEGRRESFLAQGRRVLRQESPLVFFSFVISGDPVVKQFGVGLAVSVAIDALVVLLIMPGPLELTGERNWFLPR